MSDNKGKLIISGIIKHDCGYGFKLTFKNKELAQYYKKMVHVIVQDDFDNIIIGHAAFDEVKQ